jgi:hypothetical protein
MKNKNDIKKEVVKELKPIYDELFEPINFQTEGSLEDTYYYMSLPNVMKILEECFDRTYDKTIS